MVLKLKKKVDGNPETTPQQQPIPSEDVIQKCNQERETNWMFLAVG